MTGKMMFPPVPAGVARHEIIGRLIQYFLADLNNSMASLDPIEPPGNYGIS